MIIIAIISATFWTTNTWYTCDRNIARVRVRPYKLCWFSIVKSLVWGNFSWYTNKNKSINCPYKVFYPKILNSTISLWTYSRKLLDSTYMVPYLNVSLRCCRHSNHPWNWVPLMLIEMKNSNHFHLGIDVGEMCYFRCLRNFQKVNSPTKCAKVAQELWHADPCTPMQSTVPTVYS